MELVLVGPVGRPFDLRTAELTLLDGVRAVDQVTLCDEDVARELSVAFGDGDAVTLEVTGIVGLVPSRFRALRTLIAEWVWLLGEKVRRRSFENLHKYLSLSTYW